MANLAAVQASLAAQFPEGAVAFGTPEPGPVDGSYRVRWRAIDAVGPECEIREGWIEIADYQGAEEAAYLPRNTVALGTQYQALEAWLTDYVNRQWDRIISIRSFDRHYQTAVVLAVTATGGGTATLDYFAIGYNSGFVALKITNLTPRI